MSAAVPEGNEREFLQVERSLPRRGDGWRADGEPEAHEDRLDHLGLGDRGRSLDPGVLLQTHAEVAIALAGFASVVAALGRPLSAFTRQHFFSLLSLSLLQVLGCLLPLWCLDLFESESTGWRFLSIVLLGLSAARIWWLVLLPSRRLGKEVLIILNPLVSKLGWGIGNASLLCLLLNTVGFPLRPNFDLYYAGLMASLLVGFALFADVATEGS